MDRRATMRSLFGRVDGYQKLDDQEHQTHLEPDGHDFPAKRARFRRLAWLALADLTLLALLLYSLRDLFSLLLHNKEMFTAHVNVTLHGPSGPARSSAQIPRILHQTCKNETIPEIWAKSQQSCLEVYSDFEYKVRLTSLLTPLTKRKNMPLTGKPNSSFGPMS